MRTSTIYTIGTALTRAQGTDVDVEVLVNGQWLRGHVTAVDGHGVVLHGDDDVLSVLRMDAISAVQVRQSAAFEALEEKDHRTHDATVHPMTTAEGGPSWAQPDAAWGRRDAGPTVGVPPTTYDGGPIVMPGPAAPVSPSRPVERPGIGPIVAPFAQPDQGLHTKLRPMRPGVLAAEAI
jgi:sRNA-binding regulator protein Hfq